MGLHDDHVLGILTKRLVPKNGVIHVARAARLLSDERLHLPITGDGSGLEDVPAELEQHFENRFAMLGAKRHEEKIPY